MIKNYRGPKKRYIGEERKKGRIRPTFQLLAFGKAKTLVPEEQLQCTDIVFVLCCIPP